MEKRAWRLMLHQTRKCSGTRAFLSENLGPSAETSWGLGPRAAGPAPGHTSPQGTIYGETIWD